MNRWSCCAWGLALALFILLAAFFSVFYDMTPRGVYETRMRELPPGRSAQLEQILGYLNHYRQAPAAFTEAEASHMRDVRVLIDIAKVLFAVLFLGLLWLARALWRRYKEKRTRAEAIASARTVLLSGGAVTIALVALLALSSLVDFSSFWVSFHHVLFPQGNWEFPADSVLITLFPEEFFESFSLSVILAAGSYAALCVLAGLLLPREHKKLVL